jgi:3-oxoisoapionate kinase
VTGSGRDLPHGPLVAWYGDDFTGSAAVMEVLTLAGHPAVLFLDVPTPEQLAKFAGYRALGIAGIARSKSPQWMEAHLPGIFKTLAALGAPITHYKVCSTLDSSPEVGSIGKAIDVAVQVLGCEWVPILTAAPAIGRYQLFANLFARSGEVVDRLDRHPVMSRHPVTPIAEADIRLHLAHQIRAPIGLIDYLALKAGTADLQLRAELKKGRRLIVIDVVDEQSLIAVGQLIWNHRGARLFAVGSQGIEYALVAYWRSEKLLGNEEVLPRATAVERMAVVSGSCSPVTAGQIAWALERGFEPIRLDPRCALDERSWTQALSRATHEALRAVELDRDPLIFTARGPDDPAVAAFLEAVSAAGADASAVNESVGQGLGRILDSILRRTGIQRAVLAGGDTSGHGAKMLGVNALTLLAPIVPGAALFRAHSDDPRYANLEIALKGGQMGPPDYFGQIKAAGEVA